MTPEKLATAKISAITEIPTDLCEMAGCANEISYQVSTDRVNWFICQYCYYELNKLRSENKCQKEN